jgi:hypothetical protein
MIVFVHSLGSLWQVKARACGETSVWNTTGIRDRKCIRSRSEIYGQIALGHRAHLELNRHGAIRPGTWMTSELTDHAGIRKLQLIVRARAGSVADRYLVTITEAFIGSLAEDGWDARETQIVSYSRWCQRQETMLLMRPFGWVKGERGTATLVPSDRGFEWRIAQWSAN